MNVTHLCELWVSLEDCDFETLSTTADGTGEPAEPGADDEDFETFHGSPDTETGLGKVQNIKSVRLQCESWNANRGPQWKLSTDVEMIGPNNTGACIVDPLMHKKWPVPSNGTDQMAKPCYKSRVEGFHGRQDMESDYTANRASTLRTEAS